MSEYKTNQQKEESVVVKTTAKEERQAFYFNEDAELVVETNKGIVVGDKSQAKMRGIFTCNAKTMAQILTIVTNKPTKLVSFANATYVAIDNDDFGKELKELKESSEKALMEMRKEITEEMRSEVNAIKYLVDCYNRLPWYKRIFKKIDIDQ